MGGSVLHDSAWPALNQSLRQRRCPSPPAASRVWLGAGAPVRWGWFPVARGTRAGAGRRWATWKWLYISTSR